MKKVVKKIAVKGIQESGTTATDSYVYLGRAESFKDSSHGDDPIPQKGKISD